MTGSNRTLIETDGSFNEIKPSSTPCLLTHPAEVTSNSSPGFCHWSKPDDKFSVSVSTVYSNRCTHIFVFLSRTPLHVMSLLHHKLVVSVVRYLPLWLLHLSPKALVTLCGCVAHHVRTGQYCCKQPNIVENKPHAH